jgi:hypothetical protein
MKEKKFFVKKYENLHYFPWKYKYKNIFSK